jgi:hypothetical protein
VWKEADKVSHLAGLIFFAVEYLMLFWFYVYGCRGEYLKPILPQGLARDILLSNIGLSTIAFLSAIPSATYYGKGEIDFKSSLWVSYFRHP